MPPKFSKSREYSRVSKVAEEEILDAYAEVLDTGVPDLQLKHMSKVFEILKIPKCFTTDISTCIQWFYDTEHLNSRSSAKWNVTRQLLEHLTLSRQAAEFEVSDVVDIDKLIKFCGRLVRFRDHYPYIKQSWGLFVSASGSKSSVLTLHDLKKVKSHLHLDDVSDSILIDMLGCGTTTIDGDIFNYTFGVGPAVGIKDFAEVLGQLGELD